MPDENNQQPTPAAPPPRSELQAKLQAALDARRNPKRAARKPASGKKPSPEDGK